MVFQPGQSGNPAGKPKGSISITALIKKELSKKPDGADSKTYVQQFIDKILDKAINDGDSQTQKIIWNYIDGLPKETVDIQSMGEKIGGFNFLRPKDDLPNNKTPTETI